MSEITMKEMEVEEISPMETTYDLLKKSLKKEEVRSKKVYGSGTFIKKDDVSITRFVCDEPCNIEEGVREVSQDTEDELEATQDLVLDGCTPSEDCEEQGVTAPGLNERNEAMRGVEDMQGSQLVYDAPETGNDECHEATMTPSIISPLDEPLQPSDERPEQDSEEENPLQPLDERPEQASEEEDPQQTSEDELEMPSTKKILSKTDDLFEEADKDSVTVGDVIQSLQQHFHIKLPKPIKKLVRHRLTHLVTQRQTDQQHESDDQSDEEPSDNDSFHPGDDFHLNTEPKQKQSKPRRKSQRKSPFKLRIHAELIRRKQKDIEKVKNEELAAANQQLSERDKKAMEAIAARFQTDTDHAREKREHDRKLLLQKLHFKKIQLMDWSQELPHNSADIPNEVTPDIKTNQHDTHSEDDLEIIGMPPPQRKLLMPNPPPIKPEPTPPSKWNSRSSLLNTLKARRRKAGNAWLARELGYKNEQDHIRDCRLIELKRRTSMKKNHFKKDPKKKVGDAQNEDLEVEEDDEENEELQLAKQIEAEKNRHEIDAEQEDDDATESLHDRDDAQYEQLPTTSTTLTDPVIDDHCTHSHGTHESNGIDASQEKTSAPDVNPNDNETNTDAKPMSPTADMPPIPSFNTEIQTQPQKEQESSSQQETQTQPPDQHDQEEHEFNEPPEPKEKNAAWKALLQKEALLQKKKRHTNLIETEAEEEEDDNNVVGLEDFGFSIISKKKDDEKEEETKIQQEDLEDVVDELSEDEGDEIAGTLARKTLEQNEEKERHKSILRRMREGYDGRRGGVASGGARAVHRFDQLVAADNRRDAKRLGLLNDDEMESEEEDEEEEEDEAVMLDKMLKDRFLGKEDGLLLDEESEEEEDDDEEDKDNVNSEDEEERKQERIAKRFAKRAKMNLILEAYDKDNEFSQTRLIDEDETTRLDLKTIKTVNCLKRSSTLISCLSTGSTSNQTNDPPSKKQKTDRETSFLSGKSSLAVALRDSRSKRKTSFLNSNAESSQGTMPSTKTLTFSHVLFHSGESQLSRGNSVRSHSLPDRKEVGGEERASLWSQVSKNRFRKP